MQPTRLAYLFADGAAPVIAETSVTKLQSPSVGWRQAPVLGAEAGAGTGMASALVLSIVDVASSIGPSRLGADGLVGEDLGEETLRRQQRIAGLLGLARIGQVGCQLRLDSADARLRLVEVLPGITRDVAPRHRQRSRQGKNGNLHHHDR